MTFQFGFIGSILARRGSVQLYSGSLGSFGRTLGVVGIIRVRWAHSGAPLASSVKFWFVGFIRAYQRGRPVHLGSFGTFGGALIVVKFILVRCVHSGSHWGHSRLLGLFMRVVAVIWVHRVHSDAHWVSLGSFGIIGSTQRRFGRGLVRSSSLWSFFRALVFVLELIWYILTPWSGSFGFIGFVRALDGGRQILGLIWVYSVSLRYAIGVTIFIRVYSGASWAWSRSFVLVGFFSALPWVRWDQSGSLGSFWPAMGVGGFIRVRCGSTLGVVVFVRGRRGVVRFIRVRWVHSGSHWGSTGSFGLVGFIWVRPGGGVVHSRSLAFVFMRSSASFVFVEFTQARPGCRWVHSNLRSLVSFQRALWVHSGSLG